MERSEQNSYMISLDKFDHNLLSGINFNSNLSGTVPLWSKTNYDDYYEFEIRASRIVEDEVSPTYKCHICNIDVPIAYKKEHNDSTKHKTCLKITGIALKRVHLFMTQDNNSNTPDKNYNTYFCAPCATEVPLKDKRNHETTKQHAISVKHDVILKDFLVLYVNDAKSDDYIKVVNDYTDNEVEVKTDSDLDCHTIEINAINGSIVNVPFNNFHGIFKIGKHIQCRVCKVLIENKHKMTHILSKEHKDTVLGPIKDVHCIRTNDDIWSHCILCNEIIMDVQLHKLSSSHNDKLKEAVKLNTEKSQSSFETTENICGLFNGTSANGTAFTSCDICDVYIPVATMRSHLRGMKHKNKLTKGTPPKIQFSGSDKLRYLLKLNENMDVICKVCLIAVDNIDEHVATNDHNRKYNDLLETNTLTQHGDKFHCKLCDAHLIKCYELFHMSGKKHLKLLDKRNAMLKCPAPSVSQLYSDVAASISKPKNLTPSHQSSSHSNKDVESSITTIPSTSQLNSNVLKLSSESHKNTASDSSIETNTMLKYNNSNSQTTSEPNINEKSNSSIFEVKFKDIFDKLYEAFSEFNVGQSKSVSESSYKTTEMGPSDTAPVMNDLNSDTFGPAVCNIDASTVNTYFCETCKVDVPNRESNMFEHINGSNHKSNVTLKDSIAHKEIAANSSTSKIQTSNNKDNSIYYCQPCKVNLTNNDSNISIHKAGNKHNSNVQRLKEALKIKPKIENINDTNKKQQKNENNHIDVEFKVNYLFKVINSRNLYCKVCKMFIKYTLEDMNGHLKCVDHVRNYNKLLLLNKVWLRPVDNRFICNYCKNETTNYNEIDHIFGKQHAANVTKSTNTEIDIVEKEPDAVTVKRVRHRKKKSGASLNV